MDSDKEAIKDELNEVDSEYRPNKRDKAIDYKEYSVRVSMCGVNWEAC